MHIKKAIAAAMAMFTLVNCAACASGKPNDSGTTGTAAGDESKSPYTDEQRAEFLGYSEACAKRALEIANATTNVYVDKNLYKRNVVKLAIECNTARGSYTPQGTSSVWEYTAFWAMQSRLIAVTTGSDADYYSKLYKNTYDSMQYYSGTASVMTYNGSGNVTMYGVNRSEKAGGANVAGIAAVYDDQMWIIRELIYAYRQNDSQLYLDEAERLTAICLDGWDTTKDASGNEYGGICWGPGYSSKHTCSNAPLILPLVNLYEIYTELGDNDKAAEYLDWAVKVYDFCIKHFSIGSGVYGDLIGSSRESAGSGLSKHYVTTSQSTSLDETTYTYNTGAMLSGAAALYRVTGEKKYYNSAKKSAKYAFTYFADKKVLDGYYLFPTKAHLWFNLILLEGYIEFYEFEPEICLEVIDAYRASLDYGYENYIKDGFMPCNYLLGWKSDKLQSYEKTKDNTKSVMDQATAVSMYAELAAFYARLAEQ